MDMVETIKIRKEWIEDRDRLVDMRMKLVANEKKIRRLKKKEKEMSQMEDAYSSAFFSRVAIATDYFGPLRYDIKTKTLVKEDEKEEDNNPFSSLMGRLSQ